MVKSTVYLTGAGPGDLKLITRRACELIKKADCIIYDYLVNPCLLRLARDDCKLIYVGKKGGAHTLSQEGINKLLVKSARTYKTVIRLKGGDPFIFGRGAEEAAYLARNKIKFEVVPGISSAIAAPAYAGISLTERTKNSSVGFITGHEDPKKAKSGINWKALVDALGTLVFLMGVGNLSMIVEKLVSSGKPKNTPVAIIRWGTTTKQKTIIGTLADIVRLARKNKIKPPAIIVVGEVVALRKNLNWFEKKPLFGRRIIVTRTREQASKLSRKLIELGADVLEVPTIKIKSLRRDKEVRDAFLARKYDWVFFTSQNGVREFAKILDRLNKDSRIFKDAKICAIGTETAKSLKAIGLRPDYVPAKFVAECVLEHFKAAGFKNKKALILRAKKARDILPKGLEKIGFNVNTVELYDTVMPRESLLLLKEALSEKVDCVTFTSSSTVDNFVKLAGRDYKRKLSGVSFSSIGPVTSKELHRFGLRVTSEAKVYTIDGLVGAISRIL